MTPANESAVRAACRRCTEEIQQAMRKKPKPNWNEMERNGASHHQQASQEN